MCENAYGVYLKEKSTDLFKSVHVCLYEPLLKHVFVFSFCSRQLIPKSIHSMFMHMTTEVGVVFPGGI